MSAASGVSAVAAPPRRPTGVRTAYRVEVAKISAQLLPRLTAVACIVGPFAFALFIHSQASVPADALFGRWLHTSGAAVPLVVLAFGAIIGFPLIASIVAGDIFAGEDARSTWKTLLTRSVSRRQVFAGKVLAAMTFSTAMVALLAASSILAGALVVGWHPLIGLSGQVVAPGHALVLVLASYGVALVPTLAFTCIGIWCSVASRNSMVGVLGPPVIGLVMVLLGFLGSGVVVRSILVSTSFDAWHGILVAPAKFGPLLVGLLACAATAVLALDAARRSFRDRDFAGEGRAPASWSRLGRSVLVGGAITGVLVAGTLFDRTWITANRLQDSVGTTFRNLVVVQQGMIGHGDRTSSLRVIPFCKRSSVISGTGEGPGDDWQCQLFVNGPKLRGLSANYALTVRPNGCYTAEGPPSVIGPLHIRTQDGTVVINPLSAFDGCMIVP